MRHDGRRTGTCRDGVPYWHSSVSPSPPTQVKAPPPQLTALQWLRVSCWLCHLCISRQRCRAANVHAVVDRRGTRTDGERPPTRNRTSVSTTCNSKNQFVLLESLQSHPSTSFARAKLCIARRNLCHNSTCPESQALRARKAAHRCLDLQT